MGPESEQNSILIIDDEPSILLFLRLCLSRRGYRVDIAKSGEAGIKKIQANDYNVIITDIAMETLSGDQVLSYLRNVLNDATPVIGMSGTPWLLDQENFDAVLYKPCSIKEILRVLQQVIKNSTRGCKTGLKPGIAVLPQQQSI